jgi:hypothetical protein
MAHLLAQDVVIELYSDGLSAGNLPNMLAELLKSVGYNHAPFYLGTWGPVHRGKPVWYVQVAPYKKYLSFGVLMIRHTYYAAHQAFAALCEEICQDHHDKEVRRVPKKYRQKIEDLQHWGRSQEMKIQEL